MRFQLHAQGVAASFRYAAKLADGETGRVLGEIAPAASLPFYVAATEGGGCRSPDLIVIINPPSSEIAERPATLTVALAAPDGVPFLEANLSVVVDVTQMNCDL